MLVLGADTRGVLFGVGRLLRELRMQRGSVRVPASLDIVSTPQVALRGHQLGYRPKTNAYDAWDVPMWEQYIRDLAIFGSNAIELIPPRSDDAADSPHFPLPQMDMMVEMSRLADEYSQDVWIWYPALDKDYGDPKQVEFALKEWAEVFSKLPRIDAIFVPGGDPGHTQPKHLMALLEKQTASLRKFHPKAEMWLSPQGFTKVWMDEFNAILAIPSRHGWPASSSDRRFATACRSCARTCPKRYRIRHYPDITHSLRSQYPVQDWDIAHALTSNREQINPRPIDEALIFRSLLPYVTDFITYSEGANDDVNKFVWSGLGWDPKVDVVQILREYSRYFIGDRYTDSFAQGLLALEQNWRGPLAANAAVYTTLEQFQAMEKAAAPRDLLNWRFQQGLYRAYYDAYVRSRLLHETAIEERALDRLKKAKPGESLDAHDGRAPHSRRSGAEAVAGVAPARLHAGRSTVPEHPPATERLPLSGDRRRPRRDARQPRNAAEQSRLAGRPLRRSEGPRRAKMNGWPLLDRIVKWTDPGTGRLLRRPRQPGATGRTSSAVSRMRRIRSASSRR